MNITSKVRRLALSNGMDYVGVAPVERFKNAPEGRRPTDLLEKAKSVVSMGVKIPRGVVEANKAAYRGYRHAIYVYMMHGYDFLNARLNLAAHLVARLLEKEGYTAMPMPASSPMDWVELKGAFSNRHAAVAAGLGEFGWCTLSATPQAGPRVRWVTVLTQAKLKPNPMYSGRKLCDRKKCNICVKICPTKAISAEEGVKLEIDGKTFEYAKLDKRKCIYGIFGFTDKALGMKAIEVPESPSSNDILKALGEESSWQKFERIAPAYCGRCIINCPIGT